MDKNIVIFGNNKKVCQKLKKSLNEAGIHADFPILKRSQLESNISKIIEISKGKHIVLVFKNEELKNITEKFHNYGVTDISIFPWDAHWADNEDEQINRYIIPIDNRKPRLDYVEVELCQCCNLNCKGCFQFINLIEEKNFYDLNIFKKDLLKLKDYFWGIGKIRLLGGEPLMNPDFLQFIISAREIFPDSDIRLVSNGLLIPTLDKSHLSILKQNNCIIDISNYIPTQKMISTITNHLDEAKVSYTVSLPINMFYKVLLSKPLEYPSESFNNCLFTHCHALGNGYLAACSHQFYISRLNATFGTEYPDTDKIDIYNTTLNGWDINTIFKKPRDFCRYCSKGMVPFKWESCPKSKAKASDWIIESTFVNVKIFPVFQKALKIFANRLRHFKQQPKN